MPLNKPLFIDSEPINGATGVEVWLSKGGDAYGAEQSLRRRTNDYPAIDSIAMSERRIPLSVKPTAQWAGTVDAFDSYVRGLFRPSSRERIITSDRDGIQYTVAMRVVRFDRASVQLWTGELLLLDPEWLGPPIGPTSLNPLDIEGNTDARPIVRITNGAAALRRRLNITEQTGQGIASHPYVVDVSADLLAANNYVVYFNGVPLPYYYVGGRLYFRVAAKIGDPSFVDILSSSAINNTTDLQSDIGGYDDGGLLLTPDIGAGVLTLDVADIWPHPKSSAVSFHPGVAGNHDDARSYTYGFDGDGDLRLIDQERTGRSWKLSNDADSYMLASSVEMTSIDNLSIRAFAGFRAGKGSSKRTTRVMRVTIQDANGNITDGPEETHTYVLALRNLAGTERHKDRSYYASFNMGGISFPDTKVARELVDEPSGLGTYYSGTVYRDDYLPREFGALAAQYIGCPVTNGAPGEWYLWFDDDAYGGLTIPAPSMSIQPKNGRMVAKTIVQPPAVFIDHQYGTTALDNVLIMNSEWVDPATLEPLGTQNDDTPEFDVYGRVRVFVAYWTRDNELPRIAREWTIMGGSVPSDAPALPNTIIAAVDGGLQYTITPPAISIPGAVKVAIGIAPAATALNHLDWGTIELTQPVSITLDGAQRPSVTQVDIQGQYINGTLRNLATGEYIRIGNVYSDAAGLEINCARKTIQGVGGVGMVYGEIRPSGGNRWFDLPVGSVDWDATDALATATKTFEYRPRLLGNS